MTNPSITHINDYELGSDRTSTISTYNNRDLDLLPASVLDQVNIYLRSLFFFFFKDPGLVHHMTNILLCFSQDK